MPLGYVINPCPKCWTPMEYKFGGLYCKKCNCVTGLPKAMCEKCWQESERDEVVVSEYEAYQAWKSKLDYPDLMEPLFIEELESALFGWWNEKVRR